MLRVALPLVVAVAVCVPIAARAQSASDFAAWISLIQSPHGAFAPDLPLGRTDGIGTLPTFRARYGSWSFGPGDDERTNLGLGADFQMGTRTLRIDGLLSTVKDCEPCRTVGVSVGMVFPLMSAKDAAQGLEVSLVPGLGYASWGDGDVSALTAAVEIPVAVRINVGSLRLRPFFTPGYGFGRASNNTDSESGSLPSYGYGLALGGSRWDASVGIRQVMLEDLPDVMGFNAAWRW